MKENVTSITRARKVLGAKGKKIPNETLEQVVRNMELLSEAIIQEAHGSKNKSVLDFISLIKDNKLKL